MAATAEFTDTQAQSLATRILALLAASGTQIACAVGQLIYETIFGSDEGLWHSMSSTKAQSLSKLAKQPGMADAQWGYTRLRESVGIYLLSKALGGFKAYPHLQVSHYRAVVNLDLAKQKSLLAQAEHSRWTVAQLEKAAGKKSPETHARNAETEIAHALKLVTAWEDPNAGLAALLITAGIEGPDLGELNKALAQVGAIATRIDDQLKGRPHPAEAPRTGIEDCQYRQDRHARPREEILEDQAQVI